MSTQQSNPFLLAADNPSRLLPLLRSNPHLASSQDDHGYSLIHAASSYNHLDLLRTLIVEFNVDVNLRDEDGETALFVAETVECARLLVEELHVDTTVKGEDEKTAREKIEAEGDFPEVSAYLLSLELGGASGLANGITDDASSSALGIRPGPSLPDGLSVAIGTMAPEDTDIDVVNLDFRRRIEELAARSDFHDEEGQRQLRELVTEALRGEVGDDRDVRQRTS